MARRATLQNACTKGVLDPDLSERQDLEHYYASFAEAENTVFHPQGGASDRGGFLLASDAVTLAAGVQRRLRRRIAPRHLTGSELSAANGGTVANLVDQDGTTVFTTNAVMADTFVAFEIDLGAAEQIDFVDLLAFSAELAGVNEAVGVEYYDGAAWQPFADAALPARKAIRMTARTRRFGTSPGGPAGTPISARYWRVVVVGGNGITGQITITGVRLWRETDGLTSINTREVSRDVATSYELVVTERNIDVFQQQKYVASIPMPLASQQVPEAVYAGGFDTQFVFAPDMAPLKIVRQGLKNEWEVGDPGFENVPDLNENIVFSGDQDEVQDLAFAGIEAGDVISFFVGDLITAPVTYVDAASLPAAAASAIGALPGITSGAGNVDVELVDTAPTVRVTLGGSNGSRAWPLLSAIVAGNADATCTTTVVQAGLDASGAVMAAETGWPRCGIIVQQRLLVGGFRAAPTSFLASRAGSFTDMENEPAIDPETMEPGPITADLAILGTLDVDDIEAIERMAVGRHLLLFTNAGEWYGETRTFDATKPFNFIKTTANGIKAGVPVVFADGGALFVQDGGETLRDMLWTDTEQSYGADPLNVLCPHLMTGIVDIAHRSARSVRDGNQIFMVNADGTMVMLALLRSQDVVAAAPWTTEGGFRSVMTNIMHDVYVVAERGGDYWLEKWMPNPGVPLDWATHYEGSPLSSVPCAYLNGRDDVWVVADGEAIGPYTVSGGAISLEEAASDVWVGLMPTWRARPQVVREKLQNQQPFRPPGRIYEATLSLKDTGQITIGTNGKTLDPVPLIRTGDAFEHGGPLQTEDGGAPGLALFDRLYTGDVTVPNLIGFSQHPYIELGRNVPAPVHIKAIRLEVAHNG